MYNYTIDGNVNNMVYTARIFFSFFFYYTYLQGFSLFFISYLFYSFFFFSSPFSLLIASKIHRTQESRVKTYLRDTMKGKKRRWKDFIVT